MTTRTTYHWRPGQPHPVAEDAVPASGPSSAASPLADPIERALTAALESLCEDRVSSSRGPRAQGLGCTPRLGRGARRPFARGVVGPPSSPCARSTAGAGRSRDGSPPSTSCPRRRGRWPRSSACGSAARARRARLTRARGTAARCRPGSVFRRARRAPRRSWPGCRAASRSPSYRARRPLWRRSSPAPKKASRRTSFAPRARPFLAGRRRRRGSRRGGRRRDAHLRRRLQRHAGTRRPPALGHGGDRCRCVRGARRCARLAGGSAPARVPDDPDRDQRQARPRRRARAAGGVSRASPGCSGTTRPRACSSRPSPSSSCPSTLSTGLRASWGCAAPESSPCAHSSPNTPPSKPASDDRYRNDSPGPPGGRAHHAALDRARDEGSRTSRTPSA